MPMFYYPCLGAFRRSFRNQLNATISKPTLMLSKSQSPVILHHRNRGILGRIPLADGGYDAENSAADPTTEHHSGSQRR